MTKPIGLLRFKSTNNHEIGIEASDVSIIEPYEAESAHTRIVLKNNQDRKSPESFAAIADRYDALILRSRTTSEDE